MLRVLKWIIGVLALIVGAFGVTWVIYMPDSTQRGVWQSDVGGMILDISRWEARTYRATSISCIHDLSFPAHLKLIELAEGARLTVQNDTLELTIDGLLDPLRFTRLDALPETCRDPWPETATAREVFDVAWAAMDENYAFFDLHGVDWAERRALAPDPQAQLTDEELYDLLQQMLAGIDDGHVQLGAFGQGYFSPATDPAWLPEDDSLTRTIMHNAAAQTIDMVLTPLADTAIHYGLREDGIGYILIRGMDVRTAFGQSSQEATELAFATVTQDLAEAKAIIIDIRTNPGGSDPVALGIVSHFIDTPLTAFTKFSRDGAGTGPTFTATVQPYDNTPLTQPVLILQTQMTGSAAEIFTLAMRELPNVTTMGEATGGGLSDILGFVLPNGWLFGLSNQTYLTPDGVSYEGTGIPPDIPFETTAAPLIAGQDPLLEAAIEQAHQLH